MAIVDLSQLTQEQLWGIQFGRQEANKDIAWQITNADEENARIEAENAQLLPEHRRPLVPVPEIFTDQSWADEQFRNLANEQYSTLIRVKEQRVLAFAKQQPPEVIEQLLSQFGIPPVIEETNEPE